MNSIYCRDFFKELIESRQRGKPRGTYSICSVHPRVIGAAMVQAGDDDLPLLIESPAREVNQFGGTSGMQPRGFRDFVFGVADQIAFPEGRIIFGGDRLGPSLWRSEPAERAMQKGCDLVADCIRAGYTKIHLDAGMPLKGDPEEEQGGLDPELIALRIARLAAAAESAFRESGRFGRENAGLPPVYLVGADVSPRSAPPVKEGFGLITEVQDFEQIFAACRKAFADDGLEDAWARVVGAVVQHGVGFADFEVDEYERSRCGKLITAAQQHSDLIFEAASTDYQRPELLRQLVEDGVTILKVGPALTFAMRECLFALECIEKEIFGWTYKARLSQLGKFLDKAMRDNPVHWQGNSNGNPQDLYLALKYSRLDSSRHYWRVPMVADAVNFLIANLKQVAIPLTLISQYLPRHYLQIREGRLTADPEALIDASVRMVLEDYSQAVFSLDIDQ
jgi:D-tagatose-1,6-bisphosphate aldolase subunit GatZ/KbaZ